VNIPNYNLNNIPGEHAWWANCLNGCPIGSLTVSNSVVPEYQNDSGTFTFNFISNIVLVTVQASRGDTEFIVDGATYTNPTTFSWPPASSHGLNVVSPQSGGAGTQFVFQSWSDGGATSHSVAPPVSTNYTVSFATQFLLTLNAGLGGSVSPAGIWTNSGAVLNIIATPSNDFTFGSWSGAGSGSYTGTNNPAGITMDGAVTESAVFLPPAQPITGVSISKSNGVSLTFGTQPGFTYHIETTTNLAPPTWTPMPGSGTNAAGNSATLNDTNPVINTQRFYRTTTP
jgi:hypothetical protein